MSLVRTEVAGVPAVHLPTTGGTCSGGLVFRVGWADETLAVRGLTHVVGHLALAALPPGEVHHHLDVLANHTVLRADGTFEEVSRFVTEVCATLRDLPAQHLDTEKSVLSAETVHDRPVGGRTQQLRYGARGYGLSAYPELGLSEVDPDLVRLWATETFTRDNVVVWFRGPGSPETIPLPLPDGMRQPLPPVPEPLADTPAFFVSPESDVLLVTAVVPRSAAAVLLAELLDTALDASLRERTGYCTRAGAQYDVRDGEDATVVVRAHCVPGRRAEAVGELVDQLARLRWAPVDSAALTTARTAVLRRRGEVDHVVAAARDLLLSRHPREDGPVEDDERALSAVGSRDVAAAAEAFHASALAQVPEMGLAWAGWHEALLAASGGDAEGVPEVRADRVTVRHGGLTAAVRFDAVSAMVAFDDGGRWLVGEDGTEIRVEPGAQSLAADAVERIDAAVDVARVVHRPARDEDDRPPPPPEVAAAAAAAERPSPLAARLLGRLRPRRPEA
ncbi:hypothetical protein KC207_02190 [Phycicoccus sp. BSK3Z-2]|uniref:Insulinase family protein n=1 Tax=Phycicoccus avicenniae TaxID=2828860 RepID=A0A941HZD1_9MICO|nr:hypothetical protein [Phycicoccus avicenniae]MBR7742101.1 hypothetical protein [Phycicoccus avicenniae]